MALTDHPSCTHEPRGSRASRLAHAAALRVSWHPIVTPNFRVHYHEGPDALAVRVTDEAEAVLPDLVRILGNAPETPIHLVITDDMDSPQGFAEVLPENIVTLFPAVPAPAPTSELGDFDNFMRLLLS